jgi:preprotein translocase subunit YajC
MAALLPILLLIVLMYFMLIRPQQKRMRAQQALLSAVQEGDEVLTTAGVYGFITAMEGDVVWVEIAEGVEVRVAKGAIARRVDPTTTPTDAPVDEIDAASSGAASTGAAGTTPELPESSDPAHPNDDEQ